VSTELVSENHSQYRSDTGRTQLSPPDLLTLQGIPQRLYSCSSATPARILGPQNQERAAYLKENGMTADQFFAGKPLPHTLFARISRTIDAIGPASIRVTKSQIAFRRRRGFAWVWLPSQYLHGRTAPLVLSVSLPWRDLSPRWKEVVEPAHGRFMHHLELADPAEIDGEVRLWLQQAWDAAK
jgi:hypothetical protein